MASRPLLVTPRGMFELQCSGNFPYTVTCKVYRTKSFAAASWRKPIEKKKSSPAGRFRLGEHLPEGEIVAIVITIVTGIIDTEWQLFSLVTPSGRLDVDSSKFPSV